jgi:hypothetical protein
LGRKERKELRGEIEGRGRGRRKGRKDVIVEGGWEEDGGWMVGEDGSGWGRGSVKV